MDINNVIDAWNEQADGFNQWDDLGADEQIQFALKLCQSPQAGSEAGSAEFNCSVVEVQAGPKYRMVNFNPIKAYHCTDCGAYRVRPADKFCPNCGVKIKIVRR